MKRPTLTLRTRILLVYLAVMGVGFYFVVGKAIDDVRPRYLESMEEVLVDTANLVASALQTQMDGPDLAAIDPEAFLEDAFARRFRALVYGMIKDRVSLRIYVTDAQGRVVYDSEDPSEVGKDYSGWRDVSRTLRGEYGARASRHVPEDDASLVLYVAAPIRSKAGDIVGVVSVGKPTATINTLVSEARRQLALTASIAAFLLLLVGVAFSIWIATPIARLTAYAEAVRDGKPAVLPRLAGREVDTLRRAFEEMRAALEGKAYVERYVQSLTHELKSPLSTIRGASEILQESPPDEVRHRFLGHIRQESDRIERIVDRMLQLATLEARKARAEFRNVSLRTFVERWSAEFSGEAQARGLTLSLEPSPVPDTNLSADEGLLSQALGHLLLNAMEFSPRGGSVQIHVTAEGNYIDICIHDSGTGIPDYALPRIFERFFSLARPQGGRKGTGLGLSIVREIVHLHGGSVSVTNRSGGGVTACIRLPRASATSQN